MAPMDSEQLAEKVHVSRHGSQWNQGLSFVLPVCDICGSLLADQRRHDEWHEGIEEAPDGQPAEYQAGYADGESSMGAAWTFALTEKAGLPDSIPNTPMAFAAWLKENMVSITEAPDGQ